MVGIGGELVVGDEVAGDRLAIVGAKELGGGEPELAGIGICLGVEVVFELDVAPGQERLELELVLEVGEGEGLAGTEDDDLFGEVAVVGVVEAVCARRELITKVGSEAGGGGCRAWQRATTDLL